MKATNMHFHSRLQNPRATRPLSFQQNIQDFPSMTLIQSQWTGPPLKKKLIKSQLHRKGNYSPWAVEKHSSIQVQYRHIGCWHSTPLIKRRQQPLWSQLWYKVCRPKAMGGLGIINSRTFNQSLRLKCWWILFEERLKPWQKLTQNLHYQKTTNPT